MPLNLCCPECLKIAYEEGPDGGPSELYGLPFSEGGLYRWECLDEHTVALGLDADRFEVLFEIAVQAAADGYARESVATATTALERFYEFYVRLIWEAQALASDVRATVWKAVSGSSERQLGLFAATYAMETGRVPPLLDRRLVELRNRVVHRGQIPTIDEAIAFAQAVANLVHPALHELIAKHAEAASVAVARRCEETLALLQPGEEFSGWWAFPLPLSRMRAEAVPCNVAEVVALRKLQKLHAVAI
jgi:hypothetical protein